MNQKAIWLLSEDLDDAAGRIAPTAEWVEVLEELPGLRARVRRADGEELVLTWDYDLFEDEHEFPDHVPLVFEDDCYVGADLVTAMAVSGGLDLEEALPAIDAEEALALHDRCPDAAHLSPEELGGLRELAARGRA